jgi:hypothetical protein
MDDTKQKSAGMHAQRLTLAMRFFQHELGARAPDGLGILIHHGDAVHDLSQGSTIFLAQSRVVQLCPEEANKILKLNGSLRVDGFLSPIQPHHLWKRYGLRIGSTLTASSVSSIVASSPSSPSSPASAGSSSRCKTGLAAIGNQSQSVSQ